MRRLTAEHAISRVRGFIHKLAVAVLVALVFAMVTVTFSQVILRYVFNSPLRWSEELARYVFVWISFLGVYLAHRHSAHLGLDLFTARLRPTARRYSRLISDAVVLATLVWAVSTSGRLIAISVSQGSAVMGLPMIYVYAAFIVGALLISLDIVLGWAERVLGLRARRLT